MTKMDSAYEALTVRVPLPGYEATSVTESSLALKVIRADGREEDLGVVSYWHKNPFRRLLFRVKRWL